GRQRHNGPRCSIIEPGNDIDPSVPLPPCLDSGLCKTGPCCRTGRRAPQEEHKPRRNTSRGPTSKRTGSCPASLDGDNGLCPSSCKPPQPCLGAARKLFEPSAGSSVLVCLRSCHIPI